MRKIRLISLLACLSLLILACQLLNSTPQAPPDVPTAIPPTPTVPPAQSANWDDLSMYADGLIPSERERSLHTWAPAFTILTTRSALI